MTSSTDPGRITLGGTIDADVPQRRESVVTDRAVVSAPAADAATPAELMPAAADHYALFQDVSGEDLQAWTDRKSTRLNSSHR